MLTVAEVEPFDDAAKESIAGWEKTIDDKLRKDKVWLHNYTDAHSPEEFAHIARRYREAGWNVVVDVRPNNNSGATYDITIMHPMWVLPPEIARFPQASGRR